MPRRAVIAITIGLAVTLAAFVIAGGAPQPRPAPPLPSKTVDGQLVGLASLHGHPVLINFFASWCVPCRQEATALGRFAGGPPGEGHLIAIDTGDTSVRDAKQFIARYGWGFPVLDDHNSTTADAYGLRGLPTTYVVDAGGRIVSRLLGPQTQASLAAALKAA